ncbi:MAG: type 2 isopentenyl-diphosphate Delta-isomerase [Melioribacteraceae bacterium]|nr:type 2 isopentenyl-diphosphate Delta-isomerase [Melioribacteraceae bacterium]
MNNNKKNISNRKSEHVRLCLTDTVSYSKSNGFDYYDFIHFAATEIDINKISLTQKLFNKKIDYPFFISCMTGGYKGSLKINSELAKLASILNIPVGVGSQRQVLENDSLLETYKVIRKNNNDGLVFGNIGVPQIVKSKNPIQVIEKLIDIIEADAMVIHVNPLQELFQAEGELDFNGFLEKLTKITKKIKTPIIIKEVGSGINYESAKLFLDCGASGIDVAGSGGTSWSKVEILRNKNNEHDFWGEWGLRTSYCVRTVAALKKDYKFALFASGGINNSLDFAKSIALGADLSGSARLLLKNIVENGIDETKNMLLEWINDLKKLMFLTGSNNLIEFRNSKILKAEELF